MTPTPVLHLHFAGDVTEGVPVFAWRLYRPGRGEGDIVNEETGTVAFLKAASRTWHTAAWNALADACEWMADAGVSCRQLVLFGPDLMRLGLPDKAGHRKLLREINDRLRLVARHTDRNQSRHFVNAAEGMLPAAYGAFKADPDVFAADAAPSAGRSSE